MIPEASEIIRRTPDSEKRADVAAIAIAAADSLGRVYFGIPGFLPDGAIVLRFTASGLLERSFRCLLPRSGSFRQEGNPAGYMTPAYLNVVGNSS
jgi:hypothetical protein